MASRLCQRAVLSTLFLLSLQLTASTQQLYVSNRPFKGEVSKVGAALWVDVEAMAKALNMEFPLSGEQVLVKEKPIPFTLSPNGKRLVSLDQLAEAAGLSVRKNKDFGPTDVYADPSKSAGKWEYGDGYAQRSPGPFTPTLARATPSKFRWTISCSLVRKPALCSAADRCSRSS